MNMLLVLLSQPQNGRKISKNAADIAFLIKSVTDRFPVETVLRVSGGEIAVGFFALTRCCSTSGFERSDGGVLGDRHSSRNL